MKYTASSYTYVSSAALRWSVLSPNRASAVSTEDLTPDQLEYTGVLQIRAASQRDGDTAGLVVSDFAAVEMFEESKSLQPSPGSPRSPLRLEEDAGRLDGGPMSSLSGGRSDSLPSSSDTSPSLCTSVASATCDHHEHPLCLEEEALEGKTLCFPWEEDDALDPPRPPQARMFDRRNLLKLLLVTAAVCFDWNAYRTLLSKRFPSTESPLALDSVSGSSMPAIEVSPIPLTPASQRNFFHAAYWLDRSEKQSDAFVLIPRKISHMIAEICTYGKMLVAFTSQITPAFFSCALKGNSQVNETSIVAEESPRSTGLQDNFPRSNLDGVFGTLIALLGLCIFVVTCF